MSRTIVWALGGAGISAAAGWIAVSSYLVRGPETFPAEAAKAVAPVAARAPEPKREAPPVQKEPESAPPEATPASEPAESVPPAAAAPPAAPSIDLEKAIALLESDPKASYAALREILKGLSPEEAMKTAGQWRMAARKALGIGGDIPALALLAEDEGMGAALRAEAVKWILASNHLGQNNGAAHGIVWRLWENGPEAVRASALFALAYGGVRDLSDAQKGNVRSALLSGLSASDAAVRLNAILALRDRPGLASKEQLGLSSEEEFHRALERALTDPPSVKGGWWGQDELQNLGGSTSDKFFVTGREKQVFAAAQALAAHETPARTLSTLGSLLDRETSPYLVSQTLHILSRAVKEPEERATVAGRIRRSFPLLPAGSARSNLLRPLLACEGKEAEAFLRDVAANDTDDYTRKVASYILKNELHVDPASLQ